MSTVVVQVGQCGNQVGLQLCKLLLKETEQTQVYCSGDGKLRSIHVDSEPKVLANLQREIPHSMLRADNVRVGRRGRGTNWALGYHGSKDAREDDILQATMESIRKETERCACFSGVILVHSLSGGTGSGLGSRLTELLHEEYPMNYRMNCVVAPHVSGESPLQHYNALLCLSTLQRNSDCVMLFQNDDVLSRLERLAARDSENPGVTFTAMNRHIASCMAGVFLPTDTLVTHSGYSTGQEPWEMLRTVCPTPTTKFTSVTQHAKSKVSWEDLCGLCLHSVRKHSPGGHPYRSLSNLVVARGDTTGSFVAKQKLIEAKVKAAYHCVEWNPFPVDFWLARSNPLSKSACVTMAANSSQVVNYLDHVCGKAQVKFESRAFLHWYEKYGCHQEDFLEAFDTLQTTALDYTDAVT